MKTFHGKAVRLFLSLFLLIGSGAAAGNELFSRYIWGGETYPSLQGAESALWNEDFIGAAYYSYQYSWNNGILRRYDHPPTDEYSEDPKLAFWSVPSISCDDSPLYDQFGNDHCSGVTSGRCCSGEDNWWAAAQNQWPDIDCPLIKTGEGPWQQTSINDVSYPMKLPEEHLILQGRYSKFIDAEFPPGNSSGCGRNYDFTLNAIAPGFCPGGYAHFASLGGAEQCYVSVIATLTVVGAKLAEPSPNSCSVGNPCHPASGDKTLSEIDFSSDTLPFSRHYHSHQIYPDFAAMGKGWSHTYSGRILVEDGMIKVIDGRGNAERFECADSPDCSLYSSGSESGHILRPVAGGWNVYLKSGEIRQYDSSGKLILITDRSGAFREVAILYNARGQVSEVIDHRGRALRFEYNPDKLVDSVTLPDGRALLYDYAIPPTDTTNNPKRNLVKVTREDLTERHYHYEDKDEGGADRYGNLLTGITDENGSRYAAYTYDYAARVTSSEHAGGAGRIELNYTHRNGDSHDWSITEVTMPLGEVVTYDMEPGPFRKLTDIEDSRGTLAMTYDPVTGWRSSRIDREGKQSFYVYDTLHETSRIDAAGTPDERIVETDWDNLLNRVSERREPGKITTNSYNSRGQILVKVIKDTATFATRRWTYSYHELPSRGPLIGQVRTIDGPRTDVNDVTTYEYYTTDHPSGDYITGDLKAVINALGHRTLYLKYNGSGHPTRIQDANNVVTTLAYHPRGWINSRTMDGKDTYFNYDNVGNLIRLTHADGSYSEYEYDSAHRLTAMADGLNNRIEYTLDAAGNRTAEKTYDDGGVLRRQLGRVYDTLNRLEMIIDGTGDQSRYEYDNNGSRTRSLDANGNSTRFEYDPLDRLAKTIDAALGETLLGYDGRGNLISVTDPLGNTTQYTYDGLDNQIQLDSPDTEATRYEYDEAGNRTAATDARGIRTEYLYDELDRLTDIAYPDSSLNVRFTYDTGSNGVGRLSNTTDAVGTVNYTYDRRGNLLTEARSIGSDQYITTYTYNNADRLIRVTYPSGRQIDYNLDATGRTTSIDSTSETLVDNVRYAPFGPVTSFTYGNGLSWSATFNRDYELKTLQSGPRPNHLFSYDAAGNVLVISGQESGLDEQAFTYDGLYRLETSHGDYSTEVFQYDANGNRARYLNGIVDDVYGYQPQSSRLATQGNWSFTLDAAGNRTGKLNLGGYGRLYTYGDHNRLSQTSVRDDLGESVTGDYQYDGRGQRVVKSVGDTTTHFIYGPSGELLGEYKDDGSPLKEYVYLNGQPVAVFATNTVEIPTTPIEIIIDNDESGTSSTGKWDRKTNKKDFGDNYRLGDKNDTYRWTLPPNSGTFEVYAWWVSGKKNSKEANYTISHNGTKTVVVRGHNKNGGKWNLLGTFVFDGSDDEYIELHSGNGKKVSADAIRFTGINGVSSGALTTTNTFFIHTDHLGTPREATDDFQSTVWRWESRPFGNSAPDEDPDGDSEDFILNLRFPGQYFDVESGMHYNYFRTYDPNTGRYIESDPIGLRGGANTYSYALNAPVQFIDPRGLKVSGEWAKKPKFNFTDYGLTGGEFISPYLTEWGYLKIFRIYGYAAGYVNLDVQCRDSTACGEREWEIHKRIGISYRGHADFGPNAAAAAAGSVATPVTGIATSIVTLGGSALTSLLEILRAAENRGGDKIQWLYQLGPTAICLGTQ